MTVSSPPESHEGAADSPARRSWFPAHGPAMRTIRRWGVALLVLGSLGWAIWRWNSLQELRTHLGIHAAIVGIAIGVSEVLFIAGAIVMAHRTGRVVLAGTSWRPWRWLSALAEVRRGVRSVEPMRGDRPTQVGLYLNWFGALGTTGLIPIVMIAVTLPLAAWGLMGPFICDIVATCAWRKVLLNRLQEGT
jgi:hypothetical protein